MPRSAARFALGVGFGIRSPRWLKDFDYDAERSMDDMLDDSELA